MAHIPDELFQLYEKAVADGDRYTKEKIKRIIREIASQNRVIERHSSILPRIEPQKQKHPKFMG